MALRLNGQANLHSEAISTYKTSLVAGTVAVDLHFLSASRMQTTVTKALWNYCHVRLPECSFPVLCVQDSYLAVVLAR
jgi:hypothetical protein